MSATFDIERTVLCSILENQHLGADKQILQLEIRESYFTNEFHKLLCKGINRLKELDEPIDTDFLRARFMKSNLWKDEYDLYLGQVVEANPIGTIRVFTHYYNLIKENEKNLALGY